MLLHVKNFYNSPEDFESEFQYEDGPQVLDETKIVVASGDKEIKFFGSVSDWFKDASCNMAGEFAYDYEWDKKNLWYKNSMNGNIIVIVSQPGKQPISVDDIEAKLSKYDSMAREATKQLQESGLGEFKVVASWDSENGVDSFYLKRVGEEDFKYNWIELWECRHCPNVMALASDAIVVARSW
jgi:hypothetical protein